MIRAIVVAGVLAEAAAWWLVAVGRFSVWTALNPVLGAAGVAALATGRVHLSPRVSMWASVVVGVASGAALYAATSVFVRAAVRVWPRFRRHAAAIYEQRGNLSVAAVLVLAIGVAVTGEELFWRGLVQPQVAGDEGRLVGGFLAWSVYVAANVPSGTLAIVAGAVVGGAAWSVLAFWTGGVLAPLLCHAAWTGLMILLPPVRTPAVTGSRP